ncbi:TonB-dependent receptor domain-containing protein [Terriglobus sp.]|uniref:TonB-dependent receptor n=1 Tax=Terriglobus sp. TaxID=1889013 RepID=UPI003B004AAE
MKKNRCLRLIPAIALCLPPLLSAQIDRANLKGTVSDATGAAVGNATVTVSYPQTGFERTVQSTSAGEYVLSALPLGRCNVSVSAAGFETKHVNDVDLQVGDFRTVNLQLSVGAVEQAVAVAASTVTLDQDSAATGGLIARQQIENLPINGRNWAGLMILVPGAINTGSGNQTSIRFAGHGLDDNKILFDGVDASGILRQSEKSDLRIQLASESIREFRVNSALYSAEYGGTPGGQGDVVSRSGTNSLHGSAYEFLRNDVLNARALFSTRQLPLRLNQFGGSLAGRIVRDHTFFFANYEGLRQGLTQPLVGFVPSPAFAQQTGQKSPALATILAAYPMGQTATANPNVYSYTASGRQTQNEDFGLVRIDQIFNSRTSGYLRFNLDQGRLQVPLGDSTGFLQDRQQIQNNPKNGIVSLEHIFSGSLLNEAKVGVNRTPYTIANESVLPVQVAVPGFTTLRDNLVQVQNATAYSFIDTVDAVFGKHSITTGGGLRRVQINLGNSAETQLTYTSLARFTANGLDNAAVLAAVPTGGARKTEFDLFFQDQYKLRPNLTLSLGLRYDSFGAFSEVLGRSKDFDPLTCPGGFCAPGGPFYHASHADLGPRFAITWAPGMFGGDTVFRGGYGLYFGEGQLGDLTGPLNNLTSRLLLTSAQIPALSYPLTPFLALGATTANAPRGLYRGRVDQQVGEYGVSVQQRLPFQILSEIGYLGNHSAHLPSRSYINVLDPATKTRPLPAFGQVDYKLSGNNANFNGLSATLNRQFSNGLLFGANYLWSHSINDGSTGGGEQDYPQNVACRICERASSDQDVRSSFTASVVYQFGARHGHASTLRGMSGALGSGWQVSGIAIARTGLPLNVTISRSASTIPDGNSLSPQRPNLVPGVSFVPAAGRTPQHWINAAAFVLPPSGTFGNAPRNLLRGPGTWQIDGAVQKDLLHLDRYAVSLRGEGFNLLNRAQYGLPATNVSATNFGQITSQLNPGATGTATQRVFEFGLRITF